MIVWVEKRLVSALHDRQLAEHGGSAGLRDAGLLDSALARPKQLLAYGSPTPDLADLAASLAFGLARNHAFVDGNKRTAYVASRTFIELNNARLEADNKEKYLTFLSLGEGHLSESELAIWFRKHMRLIPPDSVQEQSRHYNKRNRQKDTQ